jgi:hypothetical protein
MERVGKPFFANFGSFFEGTFLIQSEYCWSNVFLCRSQRVQPIVVDPATYLARRSQIFHATEKRKTPDAFKVFTGEVYSLQYQNYIYRYTCGNAIEPKFWLGGRG